MTFSIRLNKSYEWDETRQIIHSTQLMVLFQLCIHCTHSLCMYICTWCWCTLDNIYGPEYQCIQMHTQQTHLIVYPFLFCFYCFFSLNLVYLIQYQTHQLPMWLTAIAHHLDHQTMYLLWMLPIGLLFFFFFCFILSAFS